MAITPPPIFRLDADILWRICDLLTHPPKNRRDHFALTNLRHISQVCTAWRELVLESSSLWGKAIETGCLLQKADDWREEVLRRTGQSPLDISGYAFHEYGNGPEGGLEKFLMLLFTQHWSRVRVLKLEFGLSLSSTTMAEMTLAFQRPAPQLETFEVMIDIWQVNHPAYSILSSPRLQLFADHAPLLRNFLTLDFRIQPRALWLSGTLRVLRFTEFNFFTATEILDTLAQMPFLQRLEIIVNEKKVKELQRENIGDALRKVSLPHLTELKVKTRLATGRAATRYLNVLQHIVPASGCEFQFSVCTLPSNLPLVQEVLHSYFLLFLGEKSPEELKLYMDKGSISVYSRSHSSVGFGFNLEFENDLPDPRIFVSSISSAPFHDIKRFVLRFEPDLGPPNANFMTSLISVEELCTNVSNLRPILSLLSSDDAILFPRLRNLVLYHVFDSDENFAAIADFLTQWKGAIKVLELMNDYHPKNYDRHLKNLKRFEGLKVIWCVGRDRKEHICGNDEISEAFDCASN